MAGGKKRGEAANNKPPHSLPLAMLRASSKHGGGRKQREVFFCLGPKSKVVLIHLWHPQKNKKVASKQTKRLFPPLSWYTVEEPTPPPKKRCNADSSSFSPSSSSIAHSSIPPEGDQEEGVKGERGERGCAWAEGEKEMVFPSLLSLLFLLSARREVLHKKRHLTHLLPPTVMSGPRIGGGGRGGKRRSSSFFSRRRRRRTAPSSSSGLPFLFLWARSSIRPSDRRDATRRGRVGEEKGYRFTIAHGIVSGRRR